MITKCTCVDKGKRDQSDMTSIRARGPRRIDPHGEPRGFGLRHRAHARDANIIEWPLWKSAFIDENVPVRFGPIGIPEVFTKVLYAFGPD